MADRQGSSSDERMAEQLQRLLQAIEASGYAVLPHSTEALLNSIVEVAARLFGAAAASIALLNENDQTLDFVVAYGVGNEEVVGMSIPMNKGIAGFVAMTGQPIAVSDVQHDARFSKDFAESTGYVPNSILATPLVSGDQIIGVMEVLDKIDAPSFDMHEMELLGMFANQAAIAIHQTKQIEHIGEALVLGLRRLVLSEPTERSGEILIALEQSVDEETPPQAILALADLFNEIGRMGDEEIEVCLSVLSSFADYARSRRRLR